jgi:hypothetical protein
MQSETGPSGPVFVCAAFKASALLTSLIREVGRRNLQRIRVTHASSRLFRFVIAHVALAHVLPHIECHPGVAGV